MAAFPFVRTSYDSQNSCATQSEMPQVTLKTWQELLDYMEIDPVELPWNADGATALRLLREKYGSVLREIHEKSLDEIVSIFAKSSNLRQLEALGSALQNLGLNLGHIDLDSHQFLVFVRKMDSVSEWNKRWSNMTRRQRPSRIIRTLALSRSESLHASNDEIQLPMSSIQVSDIKQIYSGRIQYSIIGHFLFIPYDVYNEDSADPYKQVRVYDLRYWPMRSLHAVNCTYNRRNIEPYTLEIETECGEKFCFVGNEFDWYKTIENAKGEIVPVYEEEKRRALSRDIAFTLGEKIPENIPEIRDAWPLLALDDCIIYHYRQPDIDHREPAEEKMTPTMRNLKMEEYRRKRNNLIEYNTVTKKYRKLMLPGVYSLNNDDITVYKNTWLILHESRHYRRPSYLLRLWNPRTNECLRLTEKDMGNNDINSIIPMSNGDVLFLLEDGRLCHPDVDLVAWLKQDMQQHQITLENWQDEKRRAFENFPDITSRYSRFRENDATDRMLVTFRDDSTYDIWIKENV